MPWEKLVRIQGFQGDAYKLTWATKAIFQVSTALEKLALPVNHKSNLSIQAQGPGIGIQARSASG